MGTFHDVDSPSATALLDEHGVTADRLPVMVLWDGRVLVAPRQDEVTDAMGATSHPDSSRCYDLAIVGAGPAGLAAAAYAASEGLEVVCLERGAAGGQAGTTSKIRNYLGFRWGISDAEFAERAPRRRS